MRVVFKADGPQTADAYSISEWWLDPGCPGPGSYRHDAHDDRNEPVRLLNVYVLGGFETEMPAIVDWFARHSP